ncbi:MAG: Gfo/Idh/MocA family oxidoreductase [Clostridia bacterium]|nr:Gfo/Idh/MocA family oxidoreductase [Clostridia bacterium]
MNIGLLGFGSMGKTHKYCVDNFKYFFSTNQDVSIASVCTRHLDKAKEIADRFSIEKYTSNEDDIIYDPTIDAIDICTPNIYHYETAKKAILAKKHIYCEKPLAVTYDQASELARLAKENGVKAAMVFNNRFLLPVMKAKELIENGSLGRIISFSARYLHSSALDINKRAGWKQDSSICGAGVLFDLGSHVIDLIYYLCGEFESVIGKGQIAYPTRVGVNGEAWQTNADEAFYVIARLKNGAYGTIEVSKISLGSNDDLVFEIRGEKGAVRFDLMELNFLYFYSTENREAGFTRIECVNRYPTPGGIFPGIKAPVGWLRGHLGNYYAFCDAVLNGKEVSPSFDDGAYVQRVMECAYISDKEGKEITL